MKGTVLDLFVAIPIVVMIALLIVVLGAVSSDLAENLGNQGAFVDTPGSNYTRIFKDTESGYNSMANMFPLIFIGGFGIVIVILASTIRSNPAYTFFSIILGMLILLLGVHTANLYETFASTAYVSTTATRYVPITFIFENFMFILLGLLILIIYIFYARQGGSGSVGRGGL